MFAMVDRFFLDGFERAGLQRSSSAILTYSISRLWLWM